MKIYGHPMSTCTRKVLAILAERNANYEFVTVDLMKGDHKKPEHVARQPFGQIPVLEEGDFHLYESRAIIRYLDEVLPGTKLTPSDAQGRATMEQWISIEASNFTPHAMKIIYEDLFKKMQGAPSDSTAVEAGKTGVNKALEVMNKRLGEVPYLAGAEFSLADICYMPYIEYLFASGHGDLITNHANVAAWWNRISTRPSWQKATGKAAA